VFGRFSRSARQVVTAAQEEARALEHGYIGTEHILLGLVRDEEGAPARVLASAGLPPERIRAEVVRIIGFGEGSEETIPFTPHAENALEDSLKQARALGHQEVREEHLFLAVLHDDGMAARILRDSDADASQLRADVIRSLTGAD
jgi:ATP-dependent Clp protease ATP-binding subunit ClpC